MTRAEKLLATHFLLESQKWHTDAYADVLQYQKVVSDVAQDLQDPPGINVVVS